MKSASLGQNFLVNRGVANRIVDSFFPVEGDILEVGPGEGVLTELIIERKKNSLFKVVEVDPSIVKKISAIEGVDLLLNRDILKINPLEDLNGGIINIISNVPYYLSRDFINWIIEWRSFFKSGVLMFQKEFVDKLLKGKGSSQSVIFNLLFKSARIMNVMPGSFSPAPKVVSTVMKFKSTNLNGLDIKSFYDFLNLSFVRKRKTLLNNLVGGWKKGEIVEALEKNCIKIGIRAEDLEACHFLDIFMVLSPGSIDIDR